MLEAAERVLIDEGHAAVTSRRVAKELGIHAGNVHYYFPTVDDLFIALFDRGASRNVDRQADALGSDRPLAELWQVAAHSRGVIVLNELMAAARLRPALRDHIDAAARSARSHQIERVRALLPEYGLDPALFPAELVVAAIQGLGLTVARGRVLGPSADREAAERAAEQLIEALEARREANRR